ncbi:hypothetical protein K2173_010141 (mitochondrion) [Erythroxylum novogranatense]|uniref:NADH-ubiquinone oxidoreductase chain 3 n=1 Tax=Erythroxylum novogranatense TaxID=1862640 RepID=A0AAV8S464_9ROSI|nr:hypothetical protein K2173_010141 [Erythroxylum novogranatense]
MFLLYEYDIFWAFLIISSIIPILAFLISGILSPINKGPEKLSSYESGIEPMGDAWLQFRIRYYMFALVFVVFDLGVSVFIEAFIFVLILIVGSVYAWRKGAFEWFLCSLIWIERKTKLPLLPLIFIRKMSVMKNVPLSE